MDKLVALGLQGAGIEMMEKTNGSLSERRSCSTAKVPFAVEESPVLRSLLVLFLVPIGPSLPFRTGSGPVFGSSGADRQVTFWLLELPCGRLFPVETVL
ncbi:MAG: hypothetical protein KDH88_03515 [Chromatiales bacterium]|nr:hypothetical protein [Chromatiales bacterium]